MADRLSSEPANDRGTGVQSVNFPTTFPVSLQFVVASASLMAMDSIAHYDLLAYLVRLPSSPLELVWGIGAVLVKGDSLQVQMAE